MTADRSPTRYAEANRALRIRLVGFSGWSEDDVGAICTLLANLRAPQGPLELQSLKESRLLETIARLAWQLGDEGIAQRAPPIPSRAQSRKDGAHSRTKQIGASQRPQRAWRSIAALGSYLDERSLVAFARAAGWAKDSALFADVWSFLSIFQTLSTRSLRSLATAARFAGGRETLEGLVRWVMTHACVLDAPCVGALATACGKLHRADLLEQVWQLRRSVPGDLGAFASAWIDADQGYRFSDVWTAYRNECRIDSPSASNTGSGPEISRMWGAFVTAASRSGSVPVTDVWLLARPVARTLEDRTLCAFAEAGGGAKNRELVSEIAAILLSRRIDQGGISTLLTAASNTGDQPLVERLCALCLAEDWIGRQLLLTAIQATYYSGSRRAFDDLWAWIQDKRPTLAKGSIGRAGCGVRDARPNGAT